jgi:hypothetical protein
MEDGIPPVPGHIAIQAPEIGRMSVIAAGAMEGRDVMTARVVRAKDLMMNFMLKNSAVLKRAASAVRSV